MFLIGSSLFKNGREITFHYIKVINSSLIGPLFLKAEPKFSRSVTKHSADLFSPACQKTREINQPQLFMSLRDKSMSSGSKNKWGHIAVFTLSPSNVYCKKCLIHQLYSVCVRPFKPLGIRCFLHYFHRLVSTKEHKR